MTSRRLDEASFEELIVAQMVAGGWSEGQASDFDPSYALDLGQLTAFIEATQPRIPEAMSLDAPTSTRHKFLARLQGEITKRGVVDILRNGVDHLGKHVDLYYPKPTAGNAKASKLFEANRFVITRQVHHSPNNHRDAVDLVAFINGLPVFTFELKNNITKQTVNDAVQQYQRDRDPKELLFAFGRTLAHFAVDDQRVKFCTHLKGAASWFLPFDQGCNDGAGNPPSPDGVKTDYLWRRVLTPQSLAEIIENYAQILTEKNPATGKKTKKAIFPRYHQLDAVRCLLADVAKNGPGRKYLIQHSAGSGKSNSIAWLVHQLTEITYNDRVAFDSIIVVTDRIILDDQLSQTIKSFLQVGSTLVHADRSGDLRRAITAGKKIIVTTVQKFPYILDDIGMEHQGRSFAIVIDEAHSSQGSKTSAAISRALGGGEDGDDEASVEDQVNRIIESKKLLPNASYFAFTATPKNRTLEMFGEPVANPDGTAGYRPFHSYTMKQAIQEGFIVDVLANFTPVSSYYKLMKTVEDDPEFDATRASKKLRAYVEGNEHAIAQKADIMVDHFLSQVIAKQKIGGQARAMIVTSSIARCIEYFHAVETALAARKSPYKAIVAFSGEHDDKGVQVTEASLNGFPSRAIAEQIRTDPYRILVVANKFQTGYDEPLLHTMYVDKTLSGVLAVQTLSRLNRAHPAKHETFVLDFANSADDIQRAFAPYYRTTVLAEATDADKLHDLVRDLDGFGVYTLEHIDEFVERYLRGETRDRLDPLLDECVAEYVELPDEDDQVKFKGEAKAFLRTYNFLSTVLPYGSVDWEKRSIFLDHLVPKLPAPKEEDLAAGILENVDLESYRIEKLASMRIVLDDEDGLIAPVPADGGASLVDPDLERLSDIVKSFNAHFGNIEWNDADRVQRFITEEIPRLVSEDEAYKNAQTNNDPVNARVESDRALGQVMLRLISDDTQLFKEFQDNESFKRWLADAVFNATYRKSA
ncbi:type I restriction endonuclease subunit R [Propionibacterium freudenreichii]|uniref:type I restriction endonuclease subunit R n=2 Tax=Propionibacterium freudenreichii TaxID=1744 RepID=UPI0021A82BDB|nr:type I restriction endonuclease [Propionibacterium freudenreichii]MCT2996641.1 type I restriction endonuclease subunit R [Propionibacterium freudenreichii]MDK9646767.1 type I restriction endonuclease subunit R [Propionibacterium freudenreichii]MDK9666693.1 type I restriction endonuclease subunit R [Propionibacterium freudenreichii]